MNEKDYEEQLAKAGEFHGHICGGIAIGTKLAMYGLELLGMELNKRHKNLIVFLEIDRCMSDAVQSVTGCSMGKRTLKQMYYGKFAATFYNTDTGEALRITDADANKKFKDEETKEEMIERFKTTSPEILFKVDKVKIELSRGDMRVNHILQYFAVNVVKKYLMGVIYYVVADLFASPVQRDLIMKL